LRDTFPVRPLGKNIGGYRGETIEIQKTLQEIERASAAANWTLDRVPGPVEILACRRTVPDPRHRVYISTGIHGDEPAGPLAALQLLCENQWPNDAALWLCPCLNPSGFPLNRRENSAGIDLNRDYRHLQSAEVRTHVQWLEHQPDFDLTLCLHEDWESAGFYLYELNPNHGPSLANPMDRPQWPEALYLASQGKTPMSYTFEAPSDFPLPVRVAALAAAVRAALRLLRAAPAGGE